jgi:hypothetical protein
MGSTSNPLSHSSRYLVSGGGKDREAQQLRDGRLLPIVAIIAPGTLIVTTVPQTTLLSQIVPQLDLRNKPDTFGLFRGPSVPPPFSSIQPRISSVYRSPVLLLNPSSKSHLRNQILPTASTSADLHFLAGLRQTASWNRSGSSWTTSQWARLPSITFSWTPDPELDAKYNATVPYQAIMSAFGRIMGGSIIVGFTSAAVAAEAATLSTLVQSTGLHSLLYSVDNATLVHAVEEMFQNITFSLMNDPQFLADS